MNWEFVSTLPPGGESRTIVARQGRRFAVLRQLEAEPTYPPPPPPPVLPLLEVALVGNVRYAVYELLRTVSLREVLFRRQKLPPVGFVARVVADAARAVRSIDPPRFHGGLSDGSVLVGFDGETRLIDFGAPRAGRFQAPGHASVSNDIFSLGAVLHSALTGFTGNYGEVLAKGLELPPPSRRNPEVTRALDVLVLRATAPDVSVRQPDGALLAMELEATLGGAMYSTADVAALVGLLLGSRQERLGGIMAERLSEVAQEALDATHEAPTIELLPLVGEAPLSTDVRAMAPPPLAVDVELDLEDGDTQVAFASEAPSSPQPERLLSAVEAATLLGLTPSQPSPSAKARPASAPNKTALVGANASLASAKPRITKNARRVLAAVLAVFAIAALASYGTKTGQRQPSPPDETTSLVEEVAPEEVLALERPTRQHQSRVDAVQPKAKEEPKHRR